MRLHRGGEVGAKLALDLGDISPDLRLTRAGLIAGAGARHAVQRYDPLLDIGAGLFRPGAAKRASRWHRALRFAARCRLARVEAALGGERGHARLAAGEAARAFRAAPGPATLLDAVGADRDTSRSWRDEERNGEDAVLAAALDDVAGLDEHRFAAGILNLQPLDVPGLVDDDPGLLQGLAEGERDGAGLRRAVEEIDGKVSGGVGAGKGQRGPIARIRRRARGEACKKRGGGCQEARQTARGIRTPRAGSPRTPRGQVRPGDGISSISHSPLTKNVLPACGKERRLSGQCFGGREAISRQPAGDCGSLPENTAPAATNELKTL